MRPHYSFIIIILVALGGFLAGYHAGTPDYVIGPYEGRGIHVELYVYKNGELVHYDPDDPATRNLFALFAMFDGAGTFTWTDGLTRSSITLGTSTTGHVFVNGNPNYNDTTTLPSIVDTGDISAVQVNITERYVQFTGSININQTSTIYGVGMYSYTDVDPTSGVVYKNVVWFYDPLPQPISVQPGDVITIIYKIILP